MSGKEICENIGLLALYSHHHLQYNSWQIGCSDEVSIFLPPLSHQSQLHFAMSATIEDLTINYEEEGVLVVKETGKEVLSKGSWTTILYRYQNLDRKTGEFGKDMFTIRRYQKRQGEYLMKSKFNISSTDQAKKIIEILQGWID